MYSEPTQTSKMELARSSILDVRLGSERLCDLQSLINQNVCDCVNGEVI